MANKYHHEATGLDIHVIHAWTVANIAARDALTVDAADVGKVCFVTDDKEFYILEDHDPVDWCPVCGEHTDENVKVSANDTTAGRLGTKLTQSGIVTLTEQNDGGDETLQVHVPNTNTDKAVEVSSNDTAPGDLESKVQAGSGISLTTVNEGGAEKIEIATTGGGVDSDEKVKCTSNDTTADYLKTKLNAGTNITITEQNDGGNETLEISATGSGSGNEKGFYRFQARDFLNPMNSDWYVDEIAPVRVDPVYPAVTVRKFDDVADAAVGMLVWIPTGKTNCTIRFKHRAATTPASQKGVGINVNWRKISDNAAMGSWGSNNSWDPIVVIPATSNAWHFNEGTRTLASQAGDVSAGNMYLMCLYRDVDDGDDTLSGDWYLLHLEVEFT